MMYQNLPLLTDLNARQILCELCREHEISVELLESLIEVQRQNLGRARQRGITQEFSAIFSAFVDEMEDSNAAG